MLEQLPGAHQLKHYSFKYNPPFDNSSLEETQVNGHKYVVMSAPINNPFAVKSIHRNYIIALFMAAKFN